MESKQAQRYRQARFKPYPHYKSTGIEWLGEVPEHWAIHKLKNIAQSTFSNVDKNPVEGEQPVHLCNYMDVYYKDFITADLELMEATANPAEIRKFALRDGDVLITKDSETWDDIAVPACVVGDHDGVLCGYHLAQIRPKQFRINGRYLFRAFCARGINDQFRVAATGITRYGLGKYWIDNGLFPVPPIEEQLSIADFLDRETARIDNLIEKKKRQIELLQEKRTALISHAVTKGLDPNAKMKDSGIEWLGEVPEHWEVYSLRRVARRIQTGSTPPTSQEHYYENGSVPWYGPGSFGVDLVLDEPVKIIAQDAVNDGVARLFKNGSAMIVAIGATIGKVGYIDRDASCNQQITVVTFDERKTVGKFGAYQLKRLEPILQGIAPSTTLPIMNQQQVGDLPIALPPLKEQVTIITYIDQQAHEVDMLVVKITESIIMLREYRTALITAAVTGKIDVKGEII